MWRPDVSELAEFYEGRLGQVAGRLIRRRIRAIWPDVKAERVLGLGYATPYLRQFVNEAERVIALMPAQQGVVHWPRTEPNLVGLADETELPLPDASIDRVLMVHSIESSEYVGALLREVWRVLAGGGTLLAVVPNRRGIWARSEVSPFGQGSPYTPRQLFRLLHDTMFLPTKAQGALYLPPSRRRFILRAAGAWETVGVRWFQTFSGVIMVEAGKQIYAVSPERPRRRARLRVPALLPTGATRRQPND